MTLRTTQMKYMKRLQAVSLVLGLALFAYLIYNIGVGQILHSVRLVGAAFIVLMLVSGMRHLLRAAAWKKCFEVDHRRRVSLFKLFNVRLAGEAIRYLSFTGPLLGEPAKAALIKRHLPLAHGLSSVIIESLTYTLAAVVVIIAGLIFVLANVTLDNNLRTAAVVISASVLFAVFLISRGIARRYFVLARAMNRLARLTGRRWFAEKASSVERIEESICNFYNQRERAFPYVLMLELASHAVSIFEVYLILRFMGVEASLLTAFVIEAASKLINTAFFFVPGQVGVSEGGNALLLRAIGLGASTGIALALIEKIRTLAWAAYGLVALLILLRRNAKALAAYEDNDEGAEILA
ncbi:MAG: flippase-like domain-containing protein [Acidobacteriota bacterium]|nr:flippase-like domain-containing protein [Acidobacteriota bacterium]